MRKDEYRINTFVNAMLYDEWKIHLHKQGRKVFGRESELSCSTRNCLEWAMKQGMESPEIMKEIMNDNQ